MSKKTETIAFRLNPEDKQKLEAYAREKDIPVSQIIRIALKEYFQSREEAKD